MQHPAAPLVVVETLAALEATWAGWRVVAARSYDPAYPPQEYREAPPLTAGTSLAVVAKRQGWTDWAVTFVVPVERNPDTLEVVSSWGTWAPVRRQQCVDAAIRQAISSSDGLAGLVETVGLVLEERLDPMDRMLYPVELAAAMLFLLDDADPSLTPQDAAEVRGVRLLADLGGLGDLAGILGLNT